MVADLSKYIYKYLLKKDIFVNIHKYLMAGYV